MTDTLRPYGAQTLLIPFRFVRTGAPGRIGPTAVEAVQGDGDLSPDPRRNGPPTSDRPDHSESTS